MQGQEQNAAAGVRQVRGARVLDCGELDGSACHLFVVDRYRSKGDPKPNTAARELGGVLVFARALTALVCCEGACDRQFYYRVAGSGLRLMSTRQK